MSNSFASLCLMPSSSGFTDGGSCWNTELTALIEPQELFNLLNSRERDARVCDPNYLLLLDSRKRDSYDAAHIVLAQHVKQVTMSQFEIPASLEVECKQIVVVYDGVSELLHGHESKAVKCARCLWSHGCRNTVRILHGGYRVFSRLYPFLRVAKQIWLPRELDDYLTYPVEVLPGAVYLGDWAQGNDTRVQQDLKIRAYVNCCRQERSRKACADESVLQIAVDDTSNADLYSQFDYIAKFIDSFDTVCVFSRYGVSRAAAVCVAYLMIKNRIPLQRAYSFVCKCQNKMRPNRGFVEQLAALEERVLGARVTVMPQE